MIDRGTRLQIFWFDEQAVAAFQAAGTNPRRPPVRELDLRGSPGGYTDSATAFIGLFLGAGQELGSYEYRDSLGRKRQRPWLTNPDARQVLDPKEWRVLVDDRTASSAELVAEALARWGAEVVGGPTLGKHEVIEQHNAQDGWLVCTVGRYLPKRGKP
jgi:C-terminal processing protease CtpA/Prc